MKATRELHELGKVRNLKLLSIFTYCKITFHRLELQGKIVWFCINIPEMLLSLRF